MKEYQVPLTGQTASTVGSLETDARLKWQYRFRQSGLVVDDRDGAMRAGRGRRAGCVLGRWPRRSVMMAEVVGDVE